MNRLRLASLAAVSVAVLVTAACGDGTTGPPATPAPVAIAPAPTATTVGIAPTVTATPLAIAPTVTSIVSALGVANAFSEAFNHSGSRTLMSIYSDDVILTLGSRFPLERTTGLV